MNWKVIGQSVIGASHILNGKTCEDAINYQLIDLDNDEQALICFVSDGAGSASYAAIASRTSVEAGVNMITEMLTANIEIDSGSLYKIAENIYDKLKLLAEQAGEPLNEFSCTLLGFVILHCKACFLQIGDGAIVRNDESGYFTTLWWPQNGEYQNTTTFLIDDPGFRNLNVKIIDDTITEVAIFTDGIQLLALNNELEIVHQPFFNDLFKWLRKATNPEHISILNKKLGDYLSGNVINSRTDDDKTLLLATKITYDSLRI